MTSIRNTRQRQVILEELRTLRTHPTAVEVYECVRRRLPRVSLGTVYRNLDLLARQGQIRRLEGFGSQARFDGDLEDHRHLRCVVCGAVDDLPQDDLWVERLSPREVGDHLVLGVRLEFEGVCPSCRAKLTPQQVERLCQDWR